MPVMAARIGRAVGQVAVDELRLFVDPRRFAEAVGLGFEVVEDADGPALAEQMIGDVRADEARAAGDEGAFLVGHDEAGGGLRTAAMDNEPSPFSSR